MEKEYTYAAFISYSSKDEKVAKALWKKLEHYRLPAVLQKQYEDVPKKMHVFLDQGDITPGDTVENALSRELADSKKLIVICSPNSALSNYVELEVSNFLKLGHSRNDIIPYIIAGDVIKDNPVNCYVPSLYGEDGKDTINGVSVVRDGKWKAFVGVLANILDVKFDEIYRRERVRRNRLIAAWSALGAVAACFICMFAWYVTPHTRYYRDYVTRWGIPEGLYGLSGTQVKSMPDYYTIRYQFGRPIELKHIDSYGRICAGDFTYEEQNKLSIAEYFYEHSYMPFIDKKLWKLKKVLCQVRIADEEKDIILPFQVVYDYIDDDNVWRYFYYDADGNMPKKLSDDFLSSKCIYYNDFSNLLAGVYGNNDGFNMPDYILLHDSSNISRQKIEYSSEGRERKVNFYNNFNQPVSDRNGICGVVCDFDKQGLLIKEQYLYDGEAGSDIAYKKLDYTETGDLKLIAFYKKEETDKNDDENSSSEKNKFSMNKARGFAFAEFDVGVDEDGNSVKTCCFYDENRHPVYEKRLKSSSVTDVINTDGRIIKATSKRKDGDAVIMYTYDSNEKKEKYISYLNENIELTAEVFYDDDGREIKCILYDPMGNIEYDISTIYETDGEGNLFVKEITNNEIIDFNIYDKYGRHIAQSYEDFEGVIKNETKILYDGANCSVLYYKNDKLCAPYDDFYARADFNYSSTGALENVLFRDEKGNRITHPVFGFSEYRAVFSTSGLLRHEEFRDSKENLVDSTLHDYAYYNAEVDVNNKFLIQGGYFHHDNTYSNVHNSFESIFYPYKNDFITNKYTSVRYFNPLTSEKTKWWYIYDDNGKVKYLCFYDYKENGDFYVYLRDENRQVLLTEFRDSSGNLKNRPNTNYSIRKYVYSDDGSVCYEHYTPDGIAESALYKNASGIRTKFVQFKENGEYTQVLYNENGKFKSNTNYDTAGNITAESIFDYSNSEYCKVSIKQYNDGKLKSEGFYYTNDSYKMINGIDGFCSLSNFFDGNIKRRKVAKIVNERDNTTLSPIYPLSGFILVISDMVENSSAWKIGLRNEDLLLELNSFSFFPLGTEAELENEVGEIRKLAVFRPSEENIYLFESEQKLIGFAVDPRYAGNSIDEAEKYIKDIQKAYEKWKKKERK